MFLDVDNPCYLYEDINAGVLIRLSDYIITNDIKEENLEDERVLSDMLRASDRRYVDIDPITSELLNEFKDRIIAFTIKDLREEPLYCRNHAILKVACVEYVLYPDEDNEEYEKIYRCDERKVIEAYYDLCRFRQENIPDDKTVVGIKKFFRGEPFFWNNLSEPFVENNLLETIRSYLEGISIEEAEILFIQRTSIEIIEGLPPNSI
ncbi:uncharacterized protein LOC111693290 isoform X2 [Trichogramma pretiosum]|uniref:uncharacterized protein LOC111693290 isoform X1 n=1 Tax=Trichogramma pretiosum TaxID=7493 RepID=UPI000C71B27A|nr:uncharacterized protein LOC111693290 isoform X1 [Trichogramma pretiosum]XP_023313440.1 uncharacterized protein LOC111693290 isoform X2 [Trichogramma pretiosum]